MTTGVKPELRKTGISVVGDVPWGTHLCHFYETQNDLLDILIPYFKAGLEEHEFCLWVVFYPLGEAEAKAALRSAIPHFDRHLAAGGIEIVPHTEWFLQDGKLDIKKAGATMKKKLSQALAQGYAGMRVSSNKAWLTSKDLKDFLDCEKKLKGIIAHQRATVLCSYPLAICRADELFDLARSHDFAILRRNGNWEVLETPELNQARAAVRELNEELERRIEERTRELAAANQDLKTEIAERKEAEEALRRSETKFRTLYDSTSDAVMLLGENGFFDCNLAALRIFGCATRGEFCSKHPADLSPPMQPDGTDSRTLANQQVATGMEKGRHQFEWMHKRADTGEVFAADVLLSAMELDGKRVLCATVRDITERRRTENRLAEVMKQQRAILDVSPIGISLNKGRIIEWSNPAHCAIFGYAPEEIHGMDTSALFVCTEDYERVGRELAVQIPQGLVYTAEMEYKRKNGARFWCLAQGRALDPNDLSAGVIWMLMDITERKRAQDALRESEAKLRGAFEGSQDAIGLSRKGVLVFANHAYLEVFGFEKNEQLAGTSILVHIAPSHRQQVLHYVERRAAGEKVPTVYETRGVKTNGDEFDMEVRVSTYEHQGEIYTFSTIRDITERKAAEEALKKSRAQLRALSARLQSVREEEATRMAREIHDDLGQKLTGLKMDLLRAERKIEGLQSSPTINSLLDTIVGATELADSITVSIQEIAASLRPDMLDKLGLSAALHYESRRFRERTGVLCEAHLPENELGLSTVVSTALFRIFQECLTNVARHAHATKIEAVLKLEGGWAILRVQDNGRGITEAEVANPKSLGLLGMKERTALLGGEIVFHGGPEGGTIVTVRIPQGITPVQEKDPA